ncbi:MAG: hypothetical protein Q4F29_06160 [Lachnospiraceae bacterium]|nr:hypothetical protein [Lachnospiraceae bacterium]
MKKRTLILTAAMALTLAQSAMALGYGSSSSNDSVVDLNTPPTVIVNGQVVQGGQTAAPTTPSTQNQPSAVTGVTDTSATGITTAAPVAAKEVSVDEMKQASAGVSGRVSTTTQYTGYVAGAVNAINAVNANPATVAALPSNDDLTKVAMLTGFQQINVAGTPAKAGDYLTIEVPSLQPGMKIYLLYVDPTNGMTRKICASGVNFDQKLVMVDATIQGVFSIVYEW